MRNLLSALALLLVLAQPLVAQQQAACCQLDAAGSAKAQVTFASFSQDPQFRQQHEEPIPFTLTDSRWKPVQYPTPDGDTATAWLLPAEGTSDQYLFLFHEWWGLNDYVKREAAMYQDSLGPQVNVLCLDLYDGQVATTREEAASFMRSVKETRAEDIIRGAKTYVGESAAVATLGWCFGGGWSLKASLILAEQAAGCVMYYGMPVQDVERLSTLQAPVLGIFAEQDGWITPEVAAQFADNMQAADRPVEIVSFDAQHAFANPSSPRHDAEAARDAFGRSLAFLQRAFRQ